MSDFTDELRVKVAEDMHRDWMAVCSANGDDSATRLRRIVQADIDAEKHRMNLLARLLRREGSKPESEGKG